MTHMADALAYAMPMTNLEKFTKGMSMGKVYEVHEAANGYFAQLDSGKIVVGKTLAEVTLEANALVTEEMTAVGTSGPTPEDPLNQRAKWNKGLLESLLCEFRL